MTRPVKRLTMDVAGLEQDSITAIKQLAAQQPETTVSDEVAVLRNTFIELARKIAGQWINWRSDRQRGSLSPISRMTYARR
ncbi:Uncharacterised protein [Citrobacter koseri]|uniref:Uncharacterized protein n=1 Tax=Citrobacter koseri TaxID=545 RepID=A0A2X2V509_CITKO|nr:Uncharacterised protein [Citrobacter koseri]